MQHEDRILKSIDLLTYNARETLTKYSIWATTTDSDITFNLYDALPSYTNNGSTGSAIFQKPITIPSFSSIATGIFGSVGTTSTRDIYWNFNFLSNGSGWVFDQYVQSNNGMPVASGKNPVFQVKTDASFGVANASKVVNFINSNISYTSSKTNARLNDNNFLITTPLFSVAGASSTTGTVEISSDIISLGDKYTQPTNIPSSLIKLISQNLVINGAVSSTLSQYNVLNASSGKISIGDYPTTIIIKGETSSIKYSQFGEFDISAVGTDTVDKINIIKTISTGLNSIDVYAFQGLGASIISNLLIGGNSSTSSLLTRFSTLTNEGFQLFSKSKFNSSVDKSSVVTYFDTWIDAGVDGSSSATSRTTSQYATLVNGFVDPVLATIKTNPYYFNIGTKGTLNIFGGDSINISSNSSVNYLIGGSSEIIIQKGSVVIPNLELPQYSIFSLSTLRKSSYLRFNEQVKIFPFGQTKITDNSSIAPGMEICTDISNDRSTSEQNDLYIWATFAYSTTNYHYGFYLVNDTSTTYKLMCDTYNEGGTGYPVYSSGGTTTMVMDGIPKLESDGSKFNYNRIKVIASGKNVYVVYEKRVISKQKTQSSIFTALLGLSDTTDITNSTLQFYVSSDLTATSWSKITNEFSLNYPVLKMDIHAITANDVACACGNKDKVWLALELDGGSSSIIPEVVCYNETTGKILSIDLQDTFDASTQVSTMSLGSIMNFRYTNQTTVYSPTTTITSIYKSKIVIPNTDTYNAYKFDNSGHMKITSIFTIDGTFDAYVLLHMSDTYLSNHSLRLYKINLNTLTDSLSVVGSTSTPATLNSTGTDIYVPNELTIKETSAKHFSLHTVFTKYHSKGYFYVGNVGRLGYYGSNYILSWDETSGFINNTSFVTATGSLGVVSPVTDARYVLDQTVGWTSSTELTVLSLYTIDNLSSFTGYIFYASTTTLGENLGLTMTNMSTVNSGLMLAFSPRDIFVENKVNVKYVYDRTVASTVDYRTMTTKTNTIMKSADYIDLYAPYFDSSFIDAFGTSVYQNEIHSTIFSNKKTGKFNYGIGDYDTSTMTGEPAVIENLNGGVVDDLILVANSSSIDYFHIISLAQSNAAISNGVNITINKDGNEVVSNTVNIPVSIFAKCNMSSESVNNTGISRNGLIYQIANKLSNGIDIGLFGNGYVGLDSQNVGYIPVELVSIFAKRISQNNTDTLTRSDFKITAVTSIPGITSSVTGLIYAYVNWNGDVINSGHDFPWIYDPFLNNPSLPEGVVSDNSRNAYLIKNTGNEIIPYNYSFIKSAYLIYDSVFNRTHVLIVPGDASLYSVQITSGEIFATGSVIVMSFDNTIINPFDRNFDPTMVILNNANNVVSIRVDNHNTVITKTLGMPTLSNLILGFTETNFVESSC